MPTTVTYRGQTYRLGTDPRHVAVPLPEWLNAPLPRGWDELDSSHWTGRPDRDYARVYQQRKGLLVLVSCAQQTDFRRWLHVSVSRKDTCLPTWEQMCLVKDLFIGEERQAIQVMPPRSKWVNIHKGCLHLYHCLDNDALPDFTAGGETI